MPNDHNEEELLTAALLLFNGRLPGDIIKAVLGAVPEEDHWLLRQALDGQLRVIPICVVSPAGFREQLTQDYTGDDFDEVCTLNDDELYAKLEDMYIPDGIDETIGYCIEGLREELRKDGKIVKA